MTSLAGRTLIDTYKDLLQISNGNVGVDETARYIEDGEGTPSILSLSTTRVGVGTDTPQYTLDVAGDINMTGTFKVNGQDAVFSNWTVETDNSLSRATNVSITGDFDVSGTISSQAMSVANVFQVASDGAVGGVTPTTVGQILAWDGAKWVVANNAGASSSGSSTSEVPAAFSAALTSGQSVHTINFLQTYDVVPSVVTDLQITGDGDVIPYVITDVTTSSLTVTFTDNIPNNNYKLNISFGGRDVYWSQDVLDRISYTAGNVGIGTTTPVRALHVSSDTVQDVAAFEGTNNGIVIQGHSSNAAISEIVGYKQSSAGYSDVHIRGDVTGLIVKKTTGIVGIGTTDPDTGTENSLHVHGTGTRAGFRLGGDNDTGSRIYIDSNGDNSYMDSWGLGAYQKLKINASQLLLNSGVNSGNVTIGTSDSTHKLVVDSGTGTTTALFRSSGARVFLERSEAANDTWLGWTTTGTMGWLAGMENDDHSFHIYRYANVGGTSGNSAGHALTINPNGRVGIGTTTPNHQLQVTGPNDTTFVNGRTTMNITGTDAYDQSAGSGIHFAGRYLSNGEITTFATIHAEPENPNGSRYDGSLVFGTRRTGEGSASDLERMRITSLGELAINTKTPWYVYNQTSGEGAMSYLPPVYGERTPWGATNTTGGSLMISNHAAHGWSNVYINRFGYYNGLDARFIDFLINGNGVGATISANSSANGVNYNTGSDRRLKGNIEDMTDGKDVVMQLRPRRFIWKSTHVEGDGFIADELSQVIPHAVTGEPDATNDDGTPRYQGVDYSKVVPVLTGALQQALQEIEQLKTRIETLENK